MAARSPAALPRPGKPYLVPVQPLRAGTLRRRNLPLVFAYAGCRIVPALALAYRIASMIGQGHFPSFSPSTIIPRAPRSPLRSRFSCATRGGGEDRAHRLHDLADPWTTRRGGARICAEHFGFPKMSALVRVGVSSAKASRSLASRPTAAGPGRPAP